MNLELLIAFIGATALLAIMPGPDNIYVLTESISKGWKQGVSITSGLISGVIIHTLLVATGLSLLVFQHAWLFDILKIIGALYLFYMAFGAFKEQPMTIDQIEKGNADPFFKLFRKGFLMNVLNPKVTLFFITLLPQFVSKEGYSPWVQMMLLGLVFMIISFPIFSSIALFAGRASELLASSRFWLITKYIKVALLVGLGVLMLFAKPQL